MSIFMNSPVGYLTVTARLISVNLTGIALLHLSAEVVRRRFAHIVARDRDRWHRMFIGVRNAGRKIELRQRSDGVVSTPAALYARGGRRRAPILRVALTDISGASPRNRCPGAKRCSPRFSTERRGHSGRRRLGKYSSRT
jgi:hypothetical protein